MMGVPTGNKHVLRGYGGLADCAHVFARCTLVDRSRLSASPWRLEASMSHVSTAGVEQRKLLSCGLDE